MQDLAFVGGVGRFREWCTKMIGIAVSGQIVDLAVPVDKNLPWLS